MIVFPIVFVVVIMLLAGAISWLTVPVLWNGSREPDGELIRRWHAAHDQHLLETGDHEAAVAVADGAAKPERDRIAEIRAEHAEIVAERDKEIELLRDSFKQAVEQVEQKHEVVSRLQKQLDALKPRDGAVKVMVPTEQIQIQEFGSRSSFPVPLRYAEVWLSETDLRNAALAKLHGEMHARAVQEAIYTASPSMLIPQPGGLPPVLDGPED